ncbi:hypothetical protein [Actinomyces dentalis]|uniref:hypothetical protein n=1 Tax=Actinomyces dentalis TaxID=272548 RepID=UPI0028EC1FCF|nr:hypothetical protein [Actinomyces dentalis]
MGIEIGALIALVAVLAAYLLPLLVGRREAMELSRTQDRYSSELRVLATGLSSDAADEACKRSGHARIFRRRPEVRAMNRPAVRNVRALRTERELARARHVHREARERRRVAASRRATLASALLGVLLGTVAASIFTALPWWLSLVPGALLAGSMAAGRRAARAAMMADRRESRRVAELETELMRLTGGIGVAEAQDEDGTGSRTGAGSREEPGRQKEQRAEAHRPAESGARTGARTGARAGARTEDRRTAESAGRRASRPAEAGLRAETRRSAQGARAESGSRAGAEARAGSEARAEASRPVEREESTARPGTDRTIGVAARAQSGVRAQDGATGTPDRDGARDAERAEDAVDDAVRTVVRNVVASRRGSTEAVSVTPPQGWHPVQVPAPTYTLVASAPKRAIEELDDETGPSAPVPARPTSARPSVPAEVGETLRPPIDLDAVLQRRRAAGA